MANIFAHTELTTSNPAGAKEFYARIFDWKFNDQPMGPGMTYTLIDTGSTTAGGGLQGKPMPEAPVTWLPYVEVSDVKESMAKAAAAGAKAILPFQDIGPNGSIGIFVDPFGAMLGVWARGPGMMPPPPKKAAAKKKPAKKAAAKKTVAKKPARKAAAKKKPAKKK